MKNVLSLNMKAHMDNMVIKSTLINHHWSYLKKFLILSTSITWR